MKWSTNRSAQLIFNAEWSLATKLGSRIRIAETIRAGFLHVATCIQRVVIVKPETRAVILVRTTTRDRVENGARVAAVLGTELIGDESHFLYRVRIVQWNRRAGDAKVVVVLTIDHEVVRTNSAAVRREVRSSGKGSLSGIQLTDAGS